MVLNIGKGNQPTQVNQPVQVNQSREYELTSEIETLKEQISNSEYYNNLADEKYFRLQLLNAVNRVSISLNSLQEKLIELTGGTQ